MHTLTILNSMYRSSLIMKWMNRKPLSQWSFVSEGLEHGCGWTNLKLNLIMITQNSWSLEVDNNLKRLVLQNCLLVTPALLLLVLQGSWFDPKLKFDAQITKTCCTGYYYLQIVRKIWKYLTLDSTRCLLHTLLWGASTVIDYSIVFQEILISITYSVFRIWLRQVN